jgi:hypothetical protein
LKEWMQQPPKMVKLTGPTFLVNGQHYTRQKQ